MLALEYRLDEGGVTGDYGGKTLMVGCIGPESFCTGYMLILSNCLSHFFKASWRPCCFCLSLERRVRISSGSFVRASRSLLSAGQWPLEARVVIKSWP
jgi:hypothetical protein